MHTCVHRHIVAGHRMPMQQVPTVVHMNGRPVHHGVVERAYDKLRAIIQMYVLHKQEDRRLPLPHGVSLSSIEQHMHRIVAHHRMCMCRSGDQVWRCLAGDLRVAGAAEDRLRRVRVRYHLAPQDCECFHAILHTLHAFSWQYTSRCGMLSMHRQYHVLPTLNVNLLHAQDRLPRRHHLVA